MRRRRAWRWREGFLWREQSKGEWHPEAEEQEDEAEHIAYEKWKQDQTQGAIN